MAETPLDMKMKQWVRPFEGITELPPLSPRSISEMETVLSKPILFQGIPGEITAHTRPSAKQPESNLGNIVTPDGPVKVLLSYHNSKLVIEEFPVGLGVQFDVTNEEEYESIRNARAQFRFNRRFITNDLVDPGTVTSDLEDLMSSNKVQTIHGGYYTTMGRYLDELYLPYNTQHSMWTMRILSAIGMRFIPKQSKTPTVYNKLAIAM